MHKKCGWRSWWRTTSWPRPTQSVVAKFTWAGMPAPNLCHHWSGANPPCSGASADIVTNGVHNKWEWEQSTARACQHRVGIGVPFQRASSVLHWLPRAVVTRRTNSLANWREVVKVFRGRFSLCGGEPAMSAVGIYMRLRAPTAARAASMSVRGMAKKCECCLVLCLVCPDELPPRRMVACKCCEWAESSGRSDITRAESAS
jgi:hypothetical protein